MTKSAKRSKNDRPLGLDAARAQRQNREQRWQERHGVHESAQYAKRHVIAQDVKRRRIRGIQAEESNRRGDRGDKYRIGIDANRFDNRRVSVQTAPHTQ